MSILLDGIIIGSIASAIGSVISAYHAKRVNKEKSIKLKYEKKAKELFDALLSYKNIENIDSKAFSMYLDEIIKNFEHTKKMIAEEHNKTNTADAKSRRG